MADYGILETGFKIKRLVDIQAETDASLRADLGAGINLSSSSPLGQIKGVLDEEKYKIWELIQDLYNSQYPDTSSGTSLDDSCSIIGVSRLEALYSKVTVQLLFGNISTVVPKGTQFSVVDNSNITFLTDADVTLIAGVDEIQIIAFSATPDEGGFTVIYEDEETSTVQYNEGATELQVALRVLTKLSEVTVSGSFAADFTITFEGTDGKRNHVELAEESNTLKESSVEIDITISTDTAGIPQGSVSMTATEKGDIVAAYNTLIVIDNAVSGLDSTYNTDDVIEGRYKETDNAYRIRRNSSLQISGNATVEAIRSNILQNVDNVISVTVIENDTSEIVDGLPPKSIEVIVLDGLDQDIADKIWETKAAGIETHGDESRTVTDSMGIDHDIKFTRPTSIPIYIDLNDFTVGSTYPSNGDDQVKDALVAFIDTLSVGDNVVVYPKLIGAIDSISGILNLTIAVETSADPTADDNIIIAATEIATLDKTDIVITYPA